MILGAEETLDGRLVGALLLVVGALVLVVRRTASKRETPLERSNREMMRALKDVADNVEEIQKRIGAPCPFLNGSLPRHVEDALRVILAESERNRGRR